MSFCGIVRPCLETTQSVSNVNCRMLIERARRASENATVPDHCDIHFTDLICRSIKIFDLIYNLMYVFKLSKHPYSVLILVFLRNVKEHVDE